MKSATVTVVVCTRDRPRELQSCLAALARQSLPPLEVLVVDNGTGSGALDTCTRLGARYVREPVAGLCIARNSGTRHARGEIVAFVDDDAEPEADWLERMAGAMSDPTVAAATGRIRYMEPLLDSPGMSPNHIAWNNVSWPQRIVDRATPNWFAQACLGKVGFGSNMAFRREVLLRSPGFDERLGRGRSIDGGDEDVMFMSLIAMGHRIAHIPGAVVLHPYPTERQQITARLQHDRRTSIAFLLFLWNEFPWHRLDLVSHLAAAVARRLVPRPGHGAGAPSLSYLQAAVAAFEGMKIYRAARHEWAHIPAPDYSRLMLARSSA